MQRQAARDDKPYSFFAFSPERVLGIKRAAEVRSPAARRRHPRLANRRDTSASETRNARETPDDDRLTPPTSSDPSAALSNGRRRRRAAPREDPEDRAQDGTRTPARFGSTTSRRDVASRRIPSSPRPLPRAPTDDRLSSISRSVSAASRRDDDEEVRTAPPASPVRRTRPPRWRSPSLGCLPRRFPDTDTTRLVAPIRDARTGDALPPEIQDPHLGTRTSASTSPPNAGRPRPARHPLEPPERPPRSRRSEIALAAVACLSPFSSGHVPAAKPVSPAPSSQRAEASKKSPSPRLASSPGIPARRTTRHPARGGVHTPPSPNPPRRRSPPSVARR